jgi:ABC-type uncharacterized transport system auxiliary subunit
MKRFLFLPLAALATGCISVLPEPAPAPWVFPLRAGPVEVAPRELTPIVIGVPAPAAADALAGSEMVWMKDGQIAYAERAVWQSRAPAALQGLLIETIDAQNLVRAATPIADGVRADAEIRWQLNSFEVVENGDLTARIAVDVKLMDSNSRKFVAATQVRRERKFSDRSASRAAEALQSVAREATQEIGQWAAREAQAFNLARLPPPPAPAVSAAPAPG